MKQGDKETRMNPEIVGRIMDKAQGADREALFAALQAAVACLVDAEYGRPRNNPLEHIEERLDYGHPYGHEHQAILGDTKEQTHA